MKARKSAPSFRFLFKLSWTGGACGFILLACAGNVPEPGESHLRYAESHGYTTTLANLQAGRALVLRKCDACHSFPKLKRYAPEKWEGIMDSMRVEAKLSPKQDSLIRMYMMIASGNLRDSLAAAKAGRK